MVNFPNNYMGTVAALGNEIGIQPIDLKQASEMKSERELVLSLALLICREQDIALEAWYQQVGKYGRDKIAPFIYNSKPNWNVDTGIDPVANVGMIHALTYKVDRDGVAYSFSSGKNSIDIIVAPATSHMDIYAILRINFKDMAIDLLAVSDKDLSPENLSYLWDLDRKIFNHAIKRHWASNVNFQYGDWLKIFKVMQTIPEDEIAYQFKLPDEDQEIEWV